MINSLTLGNKTFPVNIIQGPLAGISSAPFRALTWRYSKPAFSCTEMISCKTLIYQRKLARQRFTAKDPTEGPVCFQLAANNPEELAEATKLSTEYGADLIDLNCGCPVKKIRSKGSGSRLLADPGKLYKLITAMKQNTHLPVSIKIRVDSNSEEKFNTEIAKVVSEAGADFLVVHGRHWTERYDTPCNYDEIQFFVEQLKIPVIGNGDIADTESLNKMFATGCVGIMIGRGSVGQPWLINKLISGVQQREFITPSLKEIGVVLIEHVQGLMDLLRKEKFALLQARKVAKYYARDVADNIKFCVEINECENFAAFKAVCERYFI